MSLVNFFSFFHYRSVSFHFVKLLDFKFFSKAIYYGRTWITPVALLVFNQGDEGTSWYVILKGSVNVVIHGKGTVTTLQDGDDFGQLALINNAPRWVSTVTHFLNLPECFL